MSDNKEELNFNDPVQIALSLVKHAQTGEHRKFEFIKNLNELWVAKCLKKTSNKVLSDLKTVTKFTYKAYLELVAQGKDDLRILQEHIMFKEAYEFYKIERKIILDMIFEYRHYLLAGNLISSLLGKERKPEELHDYSGFGFGEETC